MLESGARSNRPGPSRRQLPAACIASSPRLCGGERGIDKVKEWAVQEPVSTRAPRYKEIILKKA